MKFLEKTLKFIEKALKFIEKQRNSLSQGPPGRRAENLKKNRWQNPLSFAFKKPIEFDVFEQIVRGGTFWGCQGGLGEAWAMKMLKKIMVIHRKNFEIHGKTLKFTEKH